ncbi:MAG: putative glycoside hydrolase, partial [Thermomicrobiales bacterium]
HIDGTQKIPRSLADQLHRRNPAFVVMHYRLGLGLGYRASTTSCNAAGGWIRILDGDRWIREWPRTPDPAWFAGAAPGKTPRYLCDWGWKLVNTDSKPWRAWWKQQVARQLDDNGADALFLDSVSVPNQLGTFSPPIAAYDPAFEALWSARIARWLPWVRTRLAVPVIANAGWWITTRDATDYSGATGVMIEGFAQPSSGSFFDHADWTLQMNRALTLTRQNRVLIAQSYPDASDLQARMFILGSSLLVQGRHTFLNLETGGQPTWFPEYDLPLGSPIDPLPATIGALEQGGLFVRHFTGGVIIVNPTDAPIVWTPPAPMTRLTPTGGGALPADAAIPPGWRLDSAPVGPSLTLAGHDAAFLVAT